MCCDGSLCSKIWLIFSVNLSASFAEHMPFFHINIFECLKCGILGLNRILLKNFVVSIVTLYLPVFMRGIFYLH